MGIDRPNMLEFRPQAWSKSNTLSLSLIIDQESRVKADDESVWPA